MNAEHLFFAQFIIEQKKISDGINDALIKVRRQSHTTSNLRFSVQSLQNLGKPGFFVSVADTKFTSILAKVYVWSCSHGKTGWNSRQLYDIVLCWPYMAWVVSNYRQYTSSRLNWRKNWSKVLQWKMFNAELESGHCC